MTLLFVYIVPILSPLCVYHIVFCMPWEDGGFGGGRWGECETEGGRERERENIFEIEVERGRGRFEVEAIQVVLIK